MMRTSHRNWVTVHRSFRPLAGMRGSGPSSAGGGCVLEMFMGNHAAISFHWKARGRTPDVARSGSTPRPQEYGGVWTVVVRIRTSTDGGGAAGQALHR